MSRWRNRAQRELRGLTFVGLEGRGGQDINAFLVVLGQAEFLQGVVDIATGTVDSTKWTMFGGAVPWVVSQILVELELRGRIEFLPGKEDLGDLVKGRVLPSDHRGLDRVLVGIELELDFKVDYPIALPQRNRQAPAQVIRITLIWRRKRLAFRDTIFDSTISKPVGHGAEPVNLKRIAKDLPAKQKVIGLPPTRQDIEQRSERLPETEEKLEESQEIAGMLGKENFVTQKDEIEGAPFIGLKLFTFDFKEFERNAAEVLRFIVRDEGIRIGKADPTIIRPGFAE